MKGIGTRTVGSEAQYTRAHSHANLARLRLSDLESGIRSRWLNAPLARGSSLYPETLVSALLLRAAHPYEEVWSEAVTRALRQTLAEFQVAGLGEVAARARLYELALCIANEVVHLQMDPIAAATIVEVSNGTLMNVCRRDWQRAAEDCATRQAREKAS